VHVRHEGADLASPTIVVQSFSKNLGFPQAFQQSSTFPELNQNLPQLQTDLEAPLQRELTIRQPLEGDERLFKPCSGVLEGRARLRLLSSVGEIVYRLLPELAPQGMMGEPLDLLAKSISVERLDRVDDSRVKLAATLPQHAAVRDLVGECVREG